MTDNVRPILAAPAPIAIDAGEHVRVEFCLVKATKVVNLLFHPSQATGIYVDRFDVGKYEVLSERVPADLFVEEIVAGAEARRDLESRNVRTFEDGRVRCELCEAAASSIEVLEHGESCPLNPPYLEPLPDIPTIGANTPIVLELVNANDHKVVVSAVIRGIQKA